MNPEELKCNLEAEVKLKGIVTADRYNLEAKVH